MAFEDNQLLFGSDPTPRIVAIELGRHRHGKGLSAGKGWQHRMRHRGISSFRLVRFRCRRSRNGKCRETCRRPEVWLAISANSWKELIALRNGLKNAGRNFFALSDPVQHYLTHTGRTLFKQLPFEELKRLQLEVLSFSGGDSDLADASLPSDHIMSIAVSDNSGWEELILVDPKDVEESERNALKRLTSVIKERDPDVIEGHNLFKFDLPYLSPGRARRKRNWIGAGAAVSSALVRRGCRSRKDDRLPEVHVDGRHFVDAFLLALFYDVGTRYFPASSERRRAALWVMR